MAFTSFGFGLFLPAAFFLYWSIPAKFRWMVLLAASYCFYLSWGVEYVLPLLFVTAVTYGCAVFMEKEGKKGRKRWLAASAVAVVLGLLLFYKYFNFLTASLAGALRAFRLNVNPITLKLVQPLGISFFSFQTVGYLVDVYKGRVPAERHIGKYALFVSFFPQILSGPIARANSLIPQLESPRAFRYDQATYGLKQMAWGYFKKLCVADLVGAYVDLVYGNLSGHRGFSLVIAALFYSLQIYCDFSGYTDIAIGAAKLFGIDLMVNFRSPYFSSSVKEFWSRWHISLSSWFRDYLYIPLGGNRKGKFRQQVNVLATFLVSGLWHGASWTFVLWGGLHGAAQVIENLSAKGGRKPEAESKRTAGWALRVCAVFLFVTSAWVFFRAQSIQDAAYVFRNMFSGLLSPISYVRAGCHALHINMFELIKLALVGLALFSFDFCALRRDPLAAISRLPLAARWAVYMSFTIFVLYLTPSASGSGFIYARF